MISCGARLAPFDIPQLREVMAYDELELDRIGDRKTAVFFIYSDCSEVIVVCAGADAVDYKLISICHKGDVVVSQDYDVAAMALGKGLKAKRRPYAIHQSGKWYTNENIDQMLMERHLNKKVRRSSHKNHMKGCTMSGGHRFCTDRSGNGDTRKRTEEDDVRFAQFFEKLILMAKSKEGAQSGTI